MRLRGAAVLVVFVLAVAPAAEATAPCFPVCRLSQGTPLLLADANELWVRRCVATSPAKQTCVLQRIDLDGRVLQEVPLAGRYDAREFERAHLDGHTVVGFGHQAWWTDLRKPYRLEPYKRPPMTLKLEGSSLVCTADGARARPTRVPLGCAPREVHVYAGGIGRDNLPEDPTATVAVMVTCAGQPAREQIAVCRP